MGFINNLSIRWKLVLATLLTSILAQLFAGAILAVYDSHVYQKQKRGEVLAQAAILAASVTASMEFNDARAAHEYLDALNANPEIDAAAVYDLRGDLFASYARNGAKSRSVPARAEPIGQHFQGSDLIVFVPVMEHGNHVGTVYLHAITEPIAARLERYIGVIMLALMGSLAVAVPISMRLNAAISNPIREIAATASRITAGDLSATVAPTQRTDEIGLLIRAFGQMVSSLREMTGQLERRVVERTAQLEAANKELEAFSYSVSHDLRAPLRAIDGFAHILEEDHAPRLDAEGKRLLSVVRSNSRKMGALIDDLLAFSKLGRQPINLVGTDMTALVHEVWSEIHADRPDGYNTLDISTLPTAQGDRSLLKQVWANLLSNASKYSGQQESPKVEVSGEENELESIYRIRDNGAGFDMKYYGRLFGVFQRLHTAAEFPGTGVGLAIVQRVVVRHGGRVWAESKVGEGATFFFSLPKRKMTSGASADSEKPEDPGVI